MISLMLIFACITKLDSEQALTNLVRPSRAKSKMARNPKNFCLRWKIDGKNTWVALKDIQDFESREPMEEANLSKKMTVFGKYKKQWLEGMY